MEEKKEDEVEIPFQQLTLMSDSSNMYKSQTDSIPIQMDSFAGDNGNIDLTSFDKRFEVKIKHSYNEQH